MLVFFSETVTIECRYISVVKCLDFRTGRPVCASCLLHFTDYTVLSKFFMQVLSYVKSFLIFFGSNSLFISQNILDLILQVYCLIIRTQYCLIFNRMDCYPGKVSVIKPLRQFLCIHNNPLSL